MREKGAKGFTLLELLIVLSLVAVLFSFASVNLVRFVTKASLDSAVATLASDIKQQQLKAMVGESDGASSSQPYGVYFNLSTPTKYVLFRGSTYSSSDSFNFSADLPKGTVVSSITFPSSQVVFQKRSGEVASFVSGSNSLTLRNTTTQQTKTISISQYGVITIQ